MDQSWVVRNQKWTTASNLDEPYLILEVVLCSLQHYKFLFLFLIFDNQFSTRQNITHSYKKKKKKKKTTTQHNSTQPRMKMNTMVLETCHINWSYNIIQYWGLLSAPHVSHLLLLLLILIFFASFMAPWPNLGFHTTRYVSSFSFPFAISLHQPGKQIIKNPIFLPASLNILKFLCNSSLFFPNQS